MLTLTNTNGRLGNHFFRALAAHFIASESGICVKYFRDFSELGLELCRGTTESAVKELNITLSENYFESQQNYTELRGHNISMMHLYCQSNYMSRKIIDYLRLNQTQIISKNPYKDRYNNNNDVFIHVRLGDVISNNPGFEYYDKILSTLEFGKGYISSDSIDHIICRKLVEKYGLEIYSNEEIKTWQFASTCKNIILSNGTFSWIIGALGFFSAVWYPKIKKQWHGDIFHSDIWNEVDFP